MTREKSMDQKIFTISGIIISLLLLLGASFYIMYSRGINLPSQEESEAVAFKIESGESVRDISANLAEQGIIKKAFYFDWYAAFKKINKKLQAGEYVINKNMSIKEIADMLAGGDVADREIEIKIIEGWTISDIGRYLEKNNITTAEEFTRLTKPGKGTCFSLESCEVSFLDQIPPDLTLEGYLFPDTYRIFKNAATEDIISKMLNNFDKKLDARMRADISAQGQKLSDIIIIASIIEKEVRGVEDMKLVSGIFWNRINNNIGLQSDATLSYVLGDKTAAHSAEELKLDSPYNTYKYRGLPPGPICNPGLNAIKAAIYPADTDYLYFLNNQETGATYFATNLEGHNRNKALYLK